MNFTLIKIMYLLYVYYKYDQDFSFIDGILHDNLKFQVELIDEVDDDKKMKYEKYNFHQDHFKKIFNNDISEEGYKVLKIGSYVYIIVLMYIQRN